ncbi:MATE family efflux transporter [Chakrabartyella piscis]|uniref:MATE family efflux transporter n=1 Tax=Chakrabartyella piscis TaxID=2918914 RepID=UPI002958AAB3|nr:MATE family efflux transporter [Chakrabartyella piscis]
MQPINMQQEFKKYVIPSMLTMVLLGFYGIADGFFIGQVMGDDGLAAINIAWPLLCVISSLGVGIGTGGAIVLSLKKGAGKEEDANKTIGNTILLLLGASILFTILYYCFSSKLLHLLGAEGILYEYGYGYMRVITFGAFFQIMGAGLSPIIKNLGKPVLAMNMMIVGLVVNLILNYVFLYHFHMNIDGIAIATCIGQAIVSFIAFYTIYKEGFKPSWLTLDQKICKHIATIGISPFGLTVTPAFVIVFTNWQALAYGGNAGVAVYTIASYASYVVYSLMQGLADGIQPILSYCKGAGEEKQISTVLQKAFLWSGVLCVIFMFSLYHFRYDFPVFYGMAHETATEAIPAMALLVFAVPFIAVARIFSAYFYALDEGTYASILVYAEPFVFTPLFLYFLPMKWDLVGIWAAYPLTQFCLAVLACVLVKRKSRKFSL